MASSVQRSGVPLVERSGRGVRLTDAGLVLAQAGSQVAVAVAEAEATWQRYRRTAVGTVRLALFHSAREMLIPGLLRWLADYPDIELITDERDVGETEFEPLTADFDIVIAHCADDGVEPQRSRLGPVRWIFADKAGASGAVHRKAPKCPQGGFL
ncbi:hypothetical protein ACFWV8_38365, partial [Streptomyces sp. NPDC058665]